MRLLLLIVFSFCTLASFSQKNVQLRSVLQYPKNLSNVWGYADSSGNEYALVGVYNGFSIVNVTNPDSAHQLFFIPGANSTWRNIKTWSHYAYVTNETADGLLIVDLQWLPDSISHHYWTGDSVFKTAHTIYIDEKGFAYLFGYNDVGKTIPTDARGALICDLKPDPEQPQVVGSYNVNYIHDGFVRSDTMWAAQIFAGEFAVVDVSNKLSLQILATQPTPNRFTHNCWLSNDGNYLFTTDERPDAFITAYDVSDLGNIRQLDRYQPAPFSFVIPHNTYFFNNYLINAYYKYGMTIVDATIPQNLVETGHYDTSPFPNSDGFNGCWGVYPFLPSGNILATDIEAGLFVLTPNFVRACYLTGDITDETTNAPVADVRVEVMTVNSWKFSEGNGSYHTGTADPGSYDVRFYKLGCLPKITTGVNLQRGITDTLHVSLSCTTFVSADIVEQQQILLQALPTAFHEQTTLRYRTNQPGTETVMEIFDSQGRSINKLALEDHEGEVILGSAYSAGIFMVKLQCGNFSKTLRIVKIQR